MHYLSLFTVPGSPPQNLVSTGVNASSISLEWSPPLEPNGIIKLYEIIYTNSTVILSQNTSSTSCTLIDLNPFTLYRISVRAYTMLGHGNQSTPVLPVKTSETGKCKYFCILLVLSTYDIKMYLD